MTDRYALIQRLLHWTIAVLVLGALVAGWIMDEFKAADLPDGLYEWIYARHKDTGVAILLLMACRIVARLIHGAPPPHPVLPDWQRRLAGTVHALFYVLLVVQPLLGLMGTWSYPAPIPVLDALGIPNPLAKDRELSGLLFDLHGIVGQALMILAVLHIAGALSHLFRGDGIVARMGFGGRG